jgi:alkanesulfonate monooxygenase SsuD/methylene tetrahydromethanopterin reductase-like flavin-dependent oxidoreductase (luciferase family)
MATTIDLVSGGRFDLGIGAGWYQREFTAFGYPFGSTGERFTQLEESVAIVSALLRDGAVDFAGSTYTLSGAYNRPKPVQPDGPPIWIGGRGDRLLELVARHADGWNIVWRLTPDEYRERAAGLDAACERAGRDPATITRSVGLYTLVGEDERDLGRRFEGLQRWTPGRALDGIGLETYAGDTMTGTPAAVLDRLSRLASLGVEEFIVSAASLPFAVYDWSMLELLAEAVIPKAQTL